MKISAKRRLIEVRRKLGIAPSGVFAEALCTPSKGVCVSLTAAGAVHRTVTAAVVSVLNEIFI